MIKDVVKELVVLKLVGRENMLKAVKMYYTDNMSPSDIARIVGLAKTSVRSKITYINYIAGFRTVYLLPTIIPVIIDKLKDIKPIVKCNGIKCMCTICNKAYSQGKIVHHIVNKHRRYIEYLVEEIMYELYSLLGVRNG